MQAIDESTELRLTTLLQEHYGTKPAKAVVVRAPARVNIIGEHTDYNGGYVLPAAVDRAVLLAGRVVPGQSIAAYTKTLEQSQTWEISSDKPADQWMKYIAGVAMALVARGAKLPGMEIAITGDVPSGAGMSSSAALCVGTVLLFAALADFPVDALTSVLIAQAVENDYLGVRVGIMDQYASRNGKAGHALLLDCRSQTHELVPLPDGMVLGLCDTRVRRALAVSAYNERRRSCEEAVRLLTPHVGGIRTLRDLDPVWLTDLKLFLPDTLYRRARHVVSENVRTLECVAAFRNGDLAKAGELVHASHVSLRDDYEVSCKELDAMADAATQAPGCYGARMMGGGFGGCAIALVDERRFDQFAEATTDGYRKAIGKEAIINRCRATDGATVLSES
jgi:galactokinase